MSCDTAKLFEHAYGFPIEGMESHLSGCRSCAGALDRIEEERDLLRRATALPSAPRVAGPSFRALPAAVAALLVIGFVAFFMSSSGNSGLPARQDDPQSNISRLVSDDPAVRKQAEQKLREMGTAALPELERLLEDPRAEVKKTARRIIDAVKRDERVRTVYREPKKIRLEKKLWTSSDAFAAIFRQASGKFTHTLKPVAGAEFGFENKSLFEALDVACGAFGFSWSLTKDGQLDVKPDASPSASRGPVRVRLDKLEADGKATAVTLAADFDRSCVNSEATFRYHIAEATGAKGEAFKGCGLTGDTGMSAGGVSLKLRGPKYKSHTLGLDGDLAGGTIRGRGCIVVPVTWKTVTIDFSKDLAGKMDLGPYEVEWMVTQGSAPRGADGPGPGTVEVNFTGPWDNTPDFLKGVLDEGSFAIDGVKTVAGRSMCPPGSFGPGISRPFSMIRPVAGEKLTFRFAVETHEVEFDFSLSGLK